MRKGTMQNLSYKIEEFDAATASDELCHKLMDYSDINLKERDPDEPPVDRSTRLLYMRDKHPYYGRKEWIVVLNIDGEETVIGSCNVNWTKPEHPGYEKNKTTGGLGMAVRKDYRRNGIGTELFKIGMKELLDNHPEVKYIIPGSIYDYVWDMMEKYGGKFSSDGAENRMYMGDVNWEMIEEWIKIGEELKKEGVTLQFFEDCPEDILEEYVAVYHETMNQQPLGEWDGEITVTPESRRMEEERNHEKGMEWYTLISREADGTISGLTEIFRHQALPHKGMQNLTGVKDKYRGRGLGKWLKAEMLSRMKEKFPEWKYISTGNDETNAPMLSINKRMGFKPFLYGKSYKFNLNDLKEKYNELHPESPIE